MTGSNIESQYLNLLRYVIGAGVEKQTRNGKVLSIFGRQIRHSMENGFPLLTTKKMAWQTIKTELQWFLRGDVDIRYLWENKCYIWDGDWYNSYVDSCSTPYSLDEMKEFALNPEKHPTRSNHFDESIWSLGPIYGKQWRSWYDGIGLDDIEYNIDQIQILIEDLKTNPDDRGMLVSAWNVADLHKMALRPCHYGFQVWTRELSIKERADLALSKGWTYTYEIEDYSHTVFDEYNIPRRAISLAWNQRSVDLPLGLPFNIASYALLLLMLADEVGMIPEELVGNLGDCHIYLNQLEGVKEQVTRTPYPSPRVSVTNGINADLSINSHDVTIEGYIHHPNIKFPLSN
jgi:thymidylate synthase